MAVLTERVRGLRDESAEMIYNKPANAFKTGTRILGKTVVTGKIAGGGVTAIYEYVLDTINASNLSNDAYRESLRGCSLPLTKMLKWQWKEKVVISDSRNVFTSRLNNLISNKKFDEWRLEVSLNDSHAARAITKYAMKDGKRKRNDELEKEALAKRTRGTDGKWNMKKVEAYELWLASIR